VPCGISAHGVASVSTLTSTTPVVAEVALAAAPQLRRALDWGVTEVEDLSSLGSPMDLLAEDG